MKNLINLHPLPWSVMPDVPANIQNCVMPLFVMDAMGRTVVTVTATSHQWATPEAKEKALLFAVAPKLVQLLEKCLENMHWEESGGPEQEVYDEARAELNKLTVKA